MTVPGTFILMPLQCLRIMAQLLAIMAVIQASPLAPKPNPSPTSWSNGLDAPTNPQGMERCNRLPYWQPKTIRHADCIHALEIFRTVEGGKSGSQRFEFLIPGAQKVSTLLPLLTPRVYAAKTCAIAVVMLAGLPPNYLPPGAYPRVWPPVDIETLDELRNAADDVVRTCVHLVGEFPRTGWTLRGRLNRSIGVLIYETGSLMDRIVTDGRGLYLDAAANQTVQA